MNNVPKVPFNNVMKKVRKRHNLTQTDVSIKSGLSLKRIQNIEKGEYYFTGVHQIANLCDALQMGRLAKKRWVYELSEYVKIPEYIYSPHQRDKDS